MKKNLYKYLLISIVGLLVSSCESFEQINKDPNNPVDVTPTMVFSGAQKKGIDYIYDTWFSGRQCLVYSQQWCQWAYTEEDRYQLRESVNNNYWNHFYTVLANFDKVVAMNTDPETAEWASAYGANENQIAIATIMKSWFVSVMTDTWGDIPYSEAGKLGEGNYYPKYDDQQEIYTTLISELTKAVNMIDVSKPGMSGGDRIYGGDPAKWKKFGNSLKARLGIHMSKVDASWKNIVAEAIAGGMFESNADAAEYKYASSPNYSMFFDGFYIGARNDFTLTRGFVNLMKGVRDELNDKTHPWEGVVDPRLEIFGGGGYYEEINGFPYGIPSEAVAPAMANIAVDFMASKSFVLNEDFAVPLMTYGEVQFIQSEYNGFSAAEYKKGIEASIQYWAGKAGMTVSDAAINDYVVAVSKNVTPETLTIQKYIDLYMNGTEAWTEIRRTGYPTQLIMPGDISISATDPTNVGSTEGQDVKFEPLEDTKGLIIARVKYPTNESTINKDQFEAAVKKLEDGTNNPYSPMFWDKRRTEAHPANK